MKKRICTGFALLLVLLALLLAPGASAAGADIRADASLTVTGIVKSVTDSESSDTYLVLTLDKPMEAVVDNYGDVAARTITEVQVSGFSPADAALAESGGAVTVTGKVVFAHTRYHYREIVLVECTAKQAPAQPPASGQTKVTALAGSVRLALNGAAIQLGAYNIANNNYVKLRDVAQLLLGTEKGFSVTWNGAEQRIDLVSGAAYTAVGGELAPLAAGTQSGVPNSAAVCLDGSPVQLTAYNIHGSNFFKLRDLGSALGFYVGWDQASGTVIVDTSRGYGEDTGSSALPDQELLELANSAASEMQDMIYGIDNGALFEQDWDSTFTCNGRDGYYKVPGLSGMRALEDAWYQKFSRRYTIEQAAGSAQYKNMYLEQDGVLYTRNMGIGDDMESIVVDKIVSRKGDEVVFSGHRVFELEGTDIGPTELSLVCENGVWKYGYLK